MVIVFRKYQSILFPIFAVVIVVAFVWLYNTPSGGGGGGSAPGSSTALILYGDSYSAAQIQRIQRVIQFDPKGGAHAGLAQELGLETLLDTLHSDSSHDSDPIINYLVILHEAKALQILTNDGKASNADVRNYVMHLPIFQTDGHYDPMRYQAITQRALGPMGFSADDLLDTVRDDLRAKKLLALVGSTVTTSPAEVKSLYTQEFQKVNANVIRLPIANVEAGIQISDDEAAKVFAQRKATFKSEEQRRVKLVNFDLSAADQKLSDKERIDALQKLANHANDFTVVMTNAGADFDKVAAKVGAKVEETGDFTMSHPGKLLVDKPKLLAAAFSLKQSQPNSDAIATTNGFSVLRLVDVVPSKQLTLDEAKPQVIALLKQDHARAQINEQAAAARKKIEAALTAKKSFADAAQAAGQKAETVPSFSLAEHDIDIPDADAILGKAVSMQPGQLSEFIPTTDGGLLVYVANREPIDEAKFKIAAPAITQILERHKQLLAFGEWLRHQRIAANPKVKQQVQ